MPRVLLIGNQCYDIRGGVKLQGGPAMYQIPIFLALGWHVDVLTRVTSDYIFPHHKSLRIYNQVSDKTTTFEYKQPTHTDTEDRILIVKNQGERLTQFDHFSDVVYDSIVVSGITNELGIQTVLEIPQLIDTKTCFLDLQSVTRSIGNAGKVVIDPPDRDIFQQFDNSYTVIKGSTPELGTYLDELLPLQSLTFATSGSSLLSIYHNKKETIQFDPISDNTIVDATGSGDIFLAGLVHSLFQGFNHFQMAKFSHHLASSFLTIQGTPSIDQSSQVVQILSGTIGE